MEFIESSSQVEVDSEDTKPDFISEIYISDSEHGSVHSDMVINNRHTSDSEESVNSLWDEHDNVAIQSGKICYYGRAGDKYKWMGKEFDVIEEKINTVLPRLTEFSDELGDAPQPIDVWNLLFTDNILQEIVIWTNYKIAKQRVKYKSPYWSDLRDIDIIELKAILGLLLYTSAFNSNQEDLSSLFATDGTGREIFRCVIASNRFAFLIGCLRFDNPDDRKERETDSVAATNCIFNAFVQNCQEAYSPSAECCIDEMLIPFKGKCKFKTFMPNKIKQYGIKVTSLIDTANNYFYNGFIDSGEQFIDNHQHNRATKAALYLTTPIWGSCRNITADTSFSSVEICEELASRSLTYVGALKKNRWEIPKEFLAKKGRPVGTSLYGFLNNTTLLSYVPIENKTILLISTKHHYKSENPDTKIPDIKSFYDRTKTGVQILEERILNNTCGRRARRWSMAIFYRLLDISCVNAQILHQMYKSTEAITTFNFLKKIAKSLVQQELERRVTKHGLRRDLRMTIRRILGSNFSSDQVTKPFIGKLEKRKRCTVCPARRNRKTSYACYLCNYPMCLECSQKVCKVCFEDPV